MIYHNKLRALIGLTHDINEASGWLVKIFREFNINLDYSIESVKLIDDLLGEQFFSREPEPNGFFADDFDNKIFAIGSYIGETIIRERKTNGKNAKWINVTNYKKYSINIGLLYGLYERIYPVKKVNERIEKGRSNELYEYITEATMSTELHNKKAPTFRK